MVFMSPNKLDNENDSFTRLKQVCNEAMDEWDPNRFRGTPSQLNFWDTFTPATIREMLDILDMFRCDDEEAHNMLDRLEARIGTGVGLGKVR